MQLDEAVWSDYRGRLLRFMRRRVADGDAAEDIVQDVLLRAYRDRATLRDTDRLSGWIFQVARRALIDHYRARRPVEELPPDLADDGPDAPGAARELARCLRPLLESLPEHYRQAVELSELEGLTQAETARRLGLTHSGAKSRVQRGRALLGEALLRCCAVERDHRGVVSDFSPNAECAGGKDGSDCACDAGRQEAD